MGLVRLDVSYDGTDFHGFARQPGLRTVQGTLEEVLARLLSTEIEVFGSGRTDAGVHARAQVVHFEQESGPPPERYPRVLARLLPRDIVVTSGSEPPPGFHARFSVRQKTYRYTLQRAKTEDVFTRRYVWHLPEELDLARMADAAKHLVGTHDFTSYCKAGTPIEDKVRTIFALNLQERGSYVDLICTGSGFLQNMVRIIAGTLVDVGMGKMTPEAVLQSLRARDRRSAGRTAPPNGLTLWQVEY